MLSIFIKGFSWPATYTYCAGGQRTCDISAMTLRHSAFGALVGFKEASRTAEVYRSRVRKATSASPNCCSSTSPCAKGIKQRLTSSSTVPVLRFEATPLRQYCPPAGTQIVCCRTCTVTRMLPFTVFGGCDKIARCVGAPPRPTVPPRPWNRVNLTPYSCAVTHYLIRKRFTAKLVRP